MNTDTKTNDKVADALRHSWVYHLPKSIWPFAQLARWERPIGWQLLMWPCLWSVILSAMHSGQSSVFQIILFHLIPMGIGAFLMRGAGCTFNDITDTDIDAQVERTRSRPLPSGRVTKKQAWAFLALQCLLGLVVLLFLSRNSNFVFVLGASSLVLVAIYPFMKRITWWPQLFLGLAFSWGALLGWASVAGTIHWPAFVLYVGSILWVIGYDTIYAHQDREDDALVGVKSTARLFGENSKQAISILYSIALLLMAVAMFASAVPSQIGYLVLTITIATCAAHFIWQIRSLDIDNAGLCLTLFKSNHIFGAMLFCGLLIAWVVG